MSLSTGYYRLAQIVASIESSGVIVADTERHELKKGETLSVNLHLEVPLIRNEGDKPSPNDTLGSPSDSKKAIPTISDITDQTGSAIGEEEPAEAETNSEEPKNGLSKSGESIGGRARVNLDTDGVSDESHSHQTTEKETYACWFDDCDATFETEHGMKIHFGRVHGDEPDTEPDYDSDALEEAYQQCETFAEMADMLNADVTPQTIRRRMIRRDIHQPTSAEDSAGDIAATVPDKPQGEKGKSAADSEDADTPDEVDNGAPLRPSEEDEETLDETGDSGSSERGDGRADKRDSTTDGGTVTDENGDESVESNETKPEGEASKADGVSAPVDDDAEPLPTDYEVKSGITIVELRNAVDKSDTLYQVQRSLDLTRGETMELLLEYDLLELVQGRMADKYKRDRMKDDIDTRITRNLEEQISPA